MDPNQQNPYEFILSPNNPQKSRMNMQSKKQQIILGTIFVSFVLIVLLVGVTFISSIGSGNSDGHKSAQAYQVEIGRILTTHNKNVRDPALSYDTSTLQSAILTDQQNFAVLLKDKKVKLSEQELAAKQNTKTDDALTSALQQNEFDTAYKNTLSKLLDAYADSLRTALQNSSSEQESETIKQALANISSLSTLAAE